MRATSRSGSSAAVCGPVLADSGASTGRYLAGTTNDFESIRLPPDGWTGSHGVACAAHSLLTMSG